MITPLSRNDQCSMFNDHWKLIIGHWSFVGAPGVTRTPGQRFRKPLLYPPELQGRKRRNVDELRVVQQGLDPLSLQPLAALQEVELDEETEPHDGPPPAPPAPELRRRSCGAARRQDIVDNQYPVAPPHRAVVHLQ